MLSVFDDTYFMRIALQEAQKAFEKGEIPVGAVLTANKRIIAKTHNETERLLDVTAHAELLAVTAGSVHIGAKFLESCTLYVTLEPCVMCAGAIAWSRIGRLVYGAKDSRRGFSQYEGLLHPKTTVQNGLLESACSDLLKRFFEKRR